MYSAAAGMAAQQQRMDAAANDLANVNTTGYKHVRVAFRDLAYAPAGFGGTQDVLIGGGTAATSLGRSLDQGALKVTGQPLDVALRGAGFIAVRGADGQPALTRDGALRTDDQGRIVTGGGLLLDPPITVPAGSTTQDVHVAEDGTVNVGGTVIGALRLLTVPNPSALAGGPDNTFLATAASGAAGTAPRTTTVTQGALEGSNVDLGAAMVNMMEAQRGFELASKAITYQDQMAEIANGIRR
ncbi:Flagellar basal-body rod protein FlgG [Paraconexibacter sp. AEG42_29]|uniref:Flagellar basal-body rod protein FlgG n=2 Tax=Paraconexibacter sp. AEG42_29 TaxID=2997339 RepID=A0AAU7ANS7_9ACTN